MFRLQVRVLPLAHGKKAIYHRQRGRYESHKETSKETRNSREKVDQEASQKGQGNVGESRPSMGIR